MLVYVGFIILTLAGSVLAGNKPPKCKHSEHLCPENEHYTRKNPRCIRTCANKWVPTSDDCKPFTGCVCDDGFVRLNDDGSGPCVHERKCPNKCKDPNAVYKKCPNPCPLSCDDPFPKVCTKACKKSGCECAPGFILDCNGKCIEPEDCPGGSPKCGANKTYVDCKYNCPTNYCPADDSRAQIACSLAYPCQGGCACIAGHLVVSPEDPRCVLASDCPKVNCTRPNEVWDPNPPGCFFESCEERGSECDYPYSSGPRCVCKEGYYRNENDICIPASECPPLACNGDFNATLTVCPNPCPKTCDDPDAGDGGCIEICLQTDCQCNDGYFLTKKDGGLCIKPEDCESCKGDPNAVYSFCPSACEPTCEKPDRPQGCTKQCMPPGCICRDGFVLNQVTGKCIKREKCPKKGCGGDPNAVYSHCPTGCEPTCDKPHPHTCNYYQCKKPGCVCKPGYVKSACGKCIKPEACPADGCHGDRNATYKDCRSHCPLTCDDQDPNRVCIASCAPSGCECNPGYVLTVKGDGGKCILPKDCPVKDKGCNGDLNATHSECPSFCPATCENRYSKEKLLCPAVCDPSGCVCKKGYILTKKGGKCVKPEDCPARCKDPNAEYKECPSACEPNCTNPDPKICTKQCMPPGCVCKKGFVLNEVTGLCVERKKCPGCNGDPNAEYKKCPSACEPTCSNPDPKFCTRQCMPPGCVCKKGFVLNEKTGKCMEREKCPVPRCKDPNAEYKECPSACEPNCTNPDPKICTKQCMPPGCVCKKGFVLNEVTGLCVERKKCPGCEGDPNAVYSECPSACEPTCTNPDPKICTLQCLPPGCVCKKGFVLNEKTGKCVEREKCPVPRCKDPNAEYKECPSACEPNCTNPDPKICTKQCMPPGCVCKKGFVLNEVTGLCVKRKKCPGCEGDPNAVYSECPSACEPTCTNPDPKICTLQCLPPGCVCKKGFVLNEKTGKCVEREKCPVPRCKDPNAEYKECPSACEPNCTNPDPKICTKQCMPPGCVCKKGFVLNEVTGLCVERKKCPGCEGDPNAEYSECPSACEPTCTNPDPKICTMQCMPPGCVCKKGFVRNIATGKCVKREECPDCKEDPNAEYSECPSACEPTCKNPDPQICTLQCLPPGCVCKKGFVLNEKTGKCVKREDCPAEPQCDGDRNATYVKSPSYCQATCKNPDPEGQCMDMPMPPGCVCKHGFLRKKKGGKCIKPEDCPGGWPSCGKNKTYVYCKVGCPNNYCPVDDSLAIIACDPIFPCPGGCVCEEGYLMVSVNDNRCILSSECPPVNCTRPNEVWDPYAPGCLHERCDDKDIPCDFQYPGQPRCRCIKGYYRNQDGVCVPECECHPSTPVCGINEIARDCKQICPPQTCQSKYIMFNCIQDLPCEPGCDCVPNYLRDKNGTCIPSEECPPLPEPEPTCGYNEVAVPCRQICPPQNCEIAYTDYACTEEHTICEPGCDCLPDHLRNGSGICIPNDQCPYPSTPVCGINEIARDCRRTCPPQSCLSKYALFRCVADLPCEPGCDCVPNYLRDETGKCIPSEKCPAPCQIPDECKRTCAEPNPPNCVYDPPKENTDGCNCKEGYILEKLGGKCIPIEQCPPDIACHGDPNARPKRCPKPCPSTCESPNQFPCKRMCEPIACECKSGFLLSNNTESARCILPDKCKGGNPCGKTGRFVDCKTDCPYDYCPVDDSRGIVFCDPPAEDCLSGCICNLNHKRKSRDDPRCIVSSDCPPVNCTRPCEKWSSCPSACLAENCEDVNNQPTVCNTLVLNCEPKCICKKNHFRNSSGICVRAQDCPPPGCGGDPNAVYNKCPSACPATCTKPDPQICTAQCMPPGCVCKEGFVLNEDTGKCIERENCPEPVCKDPHAVYKDCPSACEPTCANQEPEVCTDQCMPPGCVCKKGYVLNEKNGRCVKKRNCPGH